MTRSEAIADSLRWVAGLSGRSAFWRAARARLCDAAAAVAILFLADRLGIL